MPRPEQLWPQRCGPAWRDEPEHALWHFSEDPGIDRFEPRPSRLRGGRRLVWAIDTRHSPLFWFPRDCPRATFWPGPSISADDRRRFFGHTAAPRIHAIENAWLARVQECTLFAYRLPEVRLKPDLEVPGYWIGEAGLEPIERIEVGDLLRKHAGAGLELRLLPSLWPLWHDVIRSTVEFSGCRLAHATVPQPADLLPSIVAPPL